MTSNKILEVVIGIIVLWGIYAFLLPLLSGAVYTTALIVVVVVAILWLLRLGGIIS